MRRSSRTATRSSSSISSPDFCPPRSLPTTKRGLLLAKSFIAMKRWRLDVQPLTLYYHSYGLWRLPMLWTRSWLLPRLRWIRSSTQHALHLWRGTAGSQPLLYLRLLLAPGRRLRVLWWWRLAGRRFWSGRLRGLQPDGGWRLCLRRHRRPVARRQLRRVVCQEKNSLVSCWLPSTYVGVGGAARKSLIIKHLQKLKNLIKKISFHYI